MHPLHIGFTPDFDRERYLYHYTSVDTAVNYILINKTLRFNPLANVNDPMESDPNHWAFSNDGGDKQSIAVRDRILDHLKNRTKVVCFSRDDQSDWGSPEFNPLDFCARGHSKPRMWATYGDDHRGVCLIFDRELLRQALESGLKARGRLLYGVVRYGNLSPKDESGGAVFDLRAFKKDFDTAFDQKIKDHGDMYFLYKHVDWSAESEYRFIIVGDTPGPVELAFNDALVGVVVGRKSREKVGYSRAIGDIAQDMNVPGRYIDWGWGSANYAPLNEAARKIGPKHKSP